MGKHNIKLIQVAQSSLHDDLRELTAMSAQADRRRQASDLEAHLQSMAGIYLGTRAFAEAAADQQLLANRLYTLQKVTRVCDYIDGAVNGIQSALEAFQPTGGSTVVHHEYDRRGRLLTKTTGSEGEAVDPLAAASTTTGSAVAFLTSGIRAISAARVDAVRKTLGDIHSIESMVENAEGLLMQIRLLTNALIAIREGSQARIRQAQVLFRNIREKRATEFLSGVTAALEEYFAINGEEFQRYKGSEVTLADLQENTKLRREYLQWCLDQEFAGADPENALAKVIDSEEALCARIDEILGNPLLVRFRETLELDIKAVKAINAREFSDSSTYTHLAREAGIDPVAITLLVGMIPHLKCSGGGKIGKTDSDKALSVLEDGLKRCISVGVANGVSPSAMGMYLLFKLDKILHPLGVSPTVMRSMSDILGLPSSVGELLASFYGDSDVAVRDDRVLKTTVGKKSGKGGSVLFKTHQHAREIETGRRVSDADFAMKKAIVLAIYTYHKLCRHDGIALTDRGINNPKNRQLKKLAIAIVVASMDGVEYPRVKDYLDFLGSGESDERFLQAAVNRVGRQLEKNSDHNLGTHYYDDGAELLRDVPERDDVEEEEAVVEEEPLHRVMPVMEMRRMRSDSVLSDRSDRSENPSMLPGYVGDEEEEEELGDPLDHAEMEVGATQMRRSTHALLSSHLGLHHPRPGMTRANSLPSKLADTPVDAEADVDPTPVRSLSFTE